MPLQDPENRKALQRAMAHLTATVEKAAKVLAIEFVSGVLADPMESNTGTPVDTGWARANWVPTIGNLPYRGRKTPMSGDIEADRAAKLAMVPGAVQQLKNGLRAVDRFKLQDRYIWISNNVPYVSHEYMGPKGEYGLNAGYSKQQTAGFFERAINRSIEILSNRGDMNVSVGGWAPTTDVFAQGEVPF